jgi:putative SOS response-associated peptidase YedK
MATPFHSFVLASNLKRIQSRHPQVELPEPEEYIPNYNLKSGDSSWIITNESPRLLQQFEFGLKGFRSVQPFLRAEGNRNPDNDPNYSGSNAIFLQPGINKLIRFRRCLVLADAFITGKPDSPYLVYLRNKKRPFCFAGIWNHTKAEETGADVFSFAIITTVANSFVASLGAIRMPVILEPDDEHRWLKPSASLSGILWLLHPYPVEKMNAYSVFSVLGEAPNNASLVQPKGKPLFDESFQLDMRRTWRKKTSTNNGTLADRKR